jgi:hypothetical protein
MEGRGRTNEQVIASEDALTHYRQQQNDLAFEQQSESIILQLTPLSIHCVDSICLSIDPCIFQSSYREGCISSVSMTPGKEIPVLIKPLKFLEVGCLSLLVVSIKLLA